MRPLSLPSTPLLLSKVCKNPSNPITSILFKPYKKPLDNPPVKPIIREELNRHGREGLRGGEEGVGFDIKIIAPWRIIVGLA